MATINLGAIKFNWRGAYSGATAYVVDDVVSYNGSSYVCTAASTGNLPTDTNFWDQMSSAGTNGTDGTDLTTTLTTQGDIVYRDASGLARLGAGTSGQVLQTNGTGANPSWGTVSSDYVKLAETDISSATSSFSVDGYYTSDYDLYVYEIYDLYNTNAGRQLFWRINRSGSVVSDSNYFQIYENNYGNSGGSTTDLGRSWGTPQFFTGWDLASTSSTPSHLTITVQNPLATSRHPTYRSFWLINQDTTNIVIGNASGFHNTTGATSGLTFLPQADNIARAKVRLYGIKT